MAVVSRAKSPLGVFIAAKVTPFLIANSASMAAQETTLDDSAKALAEAIAYAVSSSFSFPGISTAITSALVLPTGGPLTPPPHTIIKSLSTE